MIILIDNYDSFTFNVYHYFSEIGAKVKVFRNDQISTDEVIKSNPSAILRANRAAIPDAFGGHSHTVIPRYSVDIGSSTSE